MWSFLIFPENMLQSTGKLYIHFSMISFVKYKKIAFVGGGTGWHVTPIVALVHEHAQVKLDYIWIGGHSSLEETEAKKANIKFFPISILKLSTVFSPKILLYPFVLIKWILQARMILVRENPDIIFSKWWPGSVAVGIACFLLEKKLWIHESDTVPGWSNRLLGRIAERIFLWFETARRYFPDLKCTVTGQIVNPDFLKPPKEYRYWKTDKQKIFVICGSQWSRNVFNAIAKTCKHLDVEWIIVLGTLNTDARELFADFPHATIYDWLDSHTIASIAVGASLVITRGSATTLAELDILHKRKLIIPLPWSSQNHQYHNALWFKENRWDTVLEDSDMMKKLQMTITQTLSGDVIDRTMERENDFLR